ncbi:Osmolarity sensor protein EnvZ [Pandoraea morbifera]|uniref:histidine kinase n=1 Tax=Pandoraea morbifera TaxID=2508300 RepID=A0A5E4WEC4_9BURK|nr:ATP-binding protein [Pandoraea morbifera]VVE23447.1 Osmolarity sensor protein EnvZ [Pandoraea morbifera]
MNWRRLLRDSLFARMAWLGIAVLLVMHLVWSALVFYQRPRQQVDGFARGLLVAIRSVDQSAVDPGSLAPPHGLRRVPLADAPAFAAEADDARASRLRHELLSRLPPGTQLHLVNERKRGNLWVLLPEHTEWIVIGLDLPPMPPFVRETVGILIGAVLLALLVAWQMQRPIARVAQAARVIARGRRPALLPEQGPHELRDLSHAFNDMAKRLAEAEDNQAIMLAGIAHDLKSPLTRLRLRADLIDNEGSREGFVRDIKSIDHIVQQFLAYARDEADTSPLVSVDAFLREQFPADEDTQAPSTPGACPAAPVPSIPVTVPGSEASCASNAPAADAPNEDGSLFVCHLRAGEAFQLPRTLLDRVMSNLVDNALEHGEPPVRLATWCDGAAGYIEVSDCGAGIAEDQVALAMRPFVRLDASRGGEGHCGLGLALVGRLVEGLGGSVRLDRSPGGGLRVTLCLPILPGLSGRPVCRGQDAAGARAAGSMA